VRTLSRREKGLLGLVAVAALVLVGLRLRQASATPAARERTEPLPPPVARIGLERLAAERPASGAGERDIFRFGSATRAEDEGELPVVKVPVPTPAPTPAVAADAAAPVAPSLPPLNLKYLGSVENRTGVKVAVLLTDRKEVLTGQAGEVVANRYRIARIGLESVDLEDVSSGQSRRIPLRGN
jgi:hypothetical protein